MADLGSQKISVNYKKLLQKDENGFVADGSGSFVSLNISGSELYASGSPEVQTMKAITVTGSIIPEGSGSWDLGSEDNPFKEIFVTNESLVFVNPQIPTGRSDRKIRLTQEDVSDWLSGDFSTKIDATSKRRLSAPIASTIKTSGVEPFLWDENDDLVSNNLTSLHIVSDRFWAWNSSLSELEVKSQKFRYGIIGNTPLNELVIGG